METKTLDQFYDFIIGKDTSKLFFFKSRILNLKTSHPANSFSMGMREDKIELHNHLSEIKEGDHIITIKKFIQMIEDICKNYNIQDMKMVGFEYETNFDDKGNLYLD